MKKVLAVAALPVLLSGCFESDRTYSVSELSEDSDLRQEILSECRENPGELAATPNCVNASEARQKVSSGSSEMPSID